VSEHGNVFMREIADHLAEALVSTGRQAEVITDALPEDGGAGSSALDNLVVAPHEFFVLFPADEAAKQRAAASCVCINTEQPGTPFFDLSMQYAGRGPVVLDINPWSLDAIRRLGLGAVHLPLGYVASMDAWRREQRSRGIDLAFLAGRTPRRETFIAGAAGMLWEWRTDLRFFSWHRPATAAHSTFAAGDAKYRSLADTRIMLNVHRGDEPYFEWARVVETMANGCVLATETSVAYEPLVPGVHMLMAPLDELAEQAVALAFDEPRRAAMAEAAYATLTGELHQATLLNAALAAAADGASRPRSSRHRDAGGGPARGVRHAVTAAASSLARAARPAPAPAGITAERQMLEKVNRDLKRAYLAQLRTVRQIERSLSLVHHGDADHITTAQTPAYAACAPDVTVVIPLFNQGSFVSDALRSVVGASSGPSGAREGAPIVDVIVVDDHSTDDSGEIAAGMLESMPWLPLCVISRAANGGLGAARNTGFAAARGRHVFALDADNVLYPSGLRVLHRHLDAAPPEVAAAYGILERFDETGALGLTSHLPWDSDLLVHGAFIDAMALWRKTAWQAVGGYTDDDQIYGWEDYDLWLGLAERGERADLVTQIVGRYREQPGSMRKISDIDMEANFVRLRERHPRLPWPS
jgi:hypothetical protein